MERMPEPQPPPSANPFAKPPPAQQPQEPNQQSQSKQQLQMPTGFASTGSQAHTQSFEEIYGVPENFLEIEVCTTTHTLSERFCQMRRLNMQ